VPEPQKLDAKAITYNLEAKNEKGALHLNRVLNVDVVLLPKENFDTLRKIFQVVRTVDEEQVALSPGASSGGN
jgi:3-dehydroquinate synthase class II